MLQPIPQRAVEAVATNFFTYARERYEILLRRRCGLPREKWTENPILREWSFCNVFREDDHVTEWFRANIREPLRSDPKVMMATIAFRWFNRINAGEVISNFVHSDWWHLDDWRDELNKVRERDGVIVTGAYMIKTPAKLNKIDGIIRCLEKAREREDELIWIMTQPYTTLEKVWRVVRTIPYMGDFTSYEVVTDLRHTDFLQNAPDILEWANPGPGCAAGLGLLFCKDRKHFNRHNEEHRAFMMALMQKLLGCAYDNRFWPDEWPRWEMRDVEHGTCEIDKYYRALGGQRLKRRYRGQSDAISERPTA